MVVVHSSDDINITHSRMVEEVNSSFSQNSTKVQHSSHDSSCQSTGKSNGKHGKSRIKVNILSYLTPTELRCKCTLVCQEWRKLSNSPYLQSHVEIDDCVLSPEEIVQRLTIHNRARVVKFVNVTDWRWVYLIGIPERKSVRRLEFVNCLLSNWNVRFVKCFPNVREVKTAHCHPQDQGQALNLSWECPNIEVVQLDEATPTPNGARSYCFALDKRKDNLKKLCVNSLVLKNIVLVFCKNLTHLELYAAQQLTIELLLRLKILRKLHTLRITYGVHISDEAFTCLFTPNTFLDLLSLNLDTCLELSDYGVEVITKGYPLLKKLQLSNCHKITDHGAEAISKNCRHLEDLNLSGCYRVQGLFLANVTFYLRSLAYLNLQACYQIPEYRIGLLFAEKPHIRLIRPSVSRV